MKVLVFSTERKHSEASVHGHVLDKNTGEHVPFLVVSLQGTTIGTTTGDTGHYFLEHLPEGTFILQVSGVGYKTQTRNVVDMETYPCQRHISVSGSEFPARCPRGEQLSELQLPAGTYQWS